MKLNKSSICVIGLLKILLLGIICGPTQAHNKVVVVPMAGDTQPLGNVVTVAKKNGDFTSPIAALNSITNAGPNNPYLIVIGPGAYTINSPIVMKPFINISGSGRQITSIVGQFGDDSLGSDAATIVASPNASLSDLSVVNSAPNSASFAIGIYNEVPLPGDPIVIPVEFSNIDIFVVRQGANNYGIYNATSISRTRVTNGDIVIAGGGTTNIPFFSTASSDYISFFFNSFMSGGVPTPESAACVGTFVGRIGLLDGVSIISFPWTSFNSSCVPE